MVTGLNYPWDDPPKHGEPFEIAPGVHWVRMPMPGGLDHINLWLLNDEEGWTIVDTGMPTDAIRGHWETIFENFLGGKPVRRVIVTHYHGDHIGLAGWLTERWNAPLWMTRTEFLYAKTNTFRPSGGTNASTVMQTFFKGAGFDDERLQQMGKRRPPRGSSTQWEIPETPPSYRRICNGDIIRIGDNRWEVVVGSGHSPEHACLYSPSLNVLLSGDQILPVITSNVSVSFMEAEGDPLREFIESLARIRSHLPPDPLVLPAHNMPFYGLHARIAALIDRHETAMDRLYELCAEPKRVVDIFPAVFDRPIDGMSLFPATGEGLAHLNCMIYRGKLVRETTNEGVNLYRQADIHDEATLDPSQMFE